MLSKWDAKILAGQIAAAWIDEKLLVDKIQEKCKTFALTQDDIERVKYELHLYAEHLRLIH